MKRLPRAFTLIELLVVISIIALLIGILLPALGAARSSARDMACLSNLRQIGVGIYGYAQEYEETLPISYFDGDGVEAQKTDWVVQITSFMANDGTGNYGEGGQDQPSPAMQCPSANLDAGRLHYSGNLMFFPTLTNFGAFSGQLKPYKLYQMKRPSEMLWIADGMQVDTTAYGQDIGDAYAALDKLDNGGANDIGDYYNPAAADNGDPIDPGANFDGNVVPGKGDLRWRHGAGAKENGGDGGTVNVLFGDGHAANHGRDDLLKRQVRADR
jgi:prepilin-type N-terminal cleavage/methylation domain-containing protein/prepilin-type processing-associated H-X9-DG protein